MTDIEDRINAALKDLYYLLSGAEATTAASVINILEANGLRIIPESQAMKIRIRGPLDLLVDVPPGYEKGLSLKLQDWDDDRMLVTHDEQRPLWIEKRTGKVTEVDMMNASQELRQAVG